jgi:hypothetical protein
MRTRSFQESTCQWGDNAGIRLSPYQPYDNGTGGRGPGPEPRESAGPRQIDQLARLGRGDRC